MLPARSPVWDMSDMSDAEDLKGRALYNALMALKPEGLAETDWAESAGVNRGFFTNLKSKEISPRAVNLRKLLSHINRSERDLYRVAAGGAVSPTADIPPSRSIDSGETVEITSLDLSVSMGPGTPIEDFVESEPVMFDLAMLRMITRTAPSRLRFIRGIGDSMEPKLLTGDRILVDTTERQLGRFDGYYWITLWGAHGLKRLRPAGPNKVEVVSVNPDHANIVVDADELTIEGRALWFAREL